MTATQLWRHTLRHDARAHGRTLLLVGLGAAVVAVTTHAAFTIFVASWFALGMWATNDLLWRDDARLVGRLPISGRVLLLAAIGRAGVRALVWSCVWLALRHDPVSIALTLTAAVGTSVLVPCAAALAAGLVASPAHALRRPDMTAEFATTPTALLGIVPGVATSSLLSLLMVVHYLPTLRAGVLAAIVCATALAFIATWRSTATLPAAGRVLAQLQRAQFAHVDVHPLSPLEGVVLRLLPPRARPWFGKDARLVRRRHPLVGALGVSLWMAAAIKYWSPDSLAWSSAIGWLLVASATVCVVQRRPPIVTAREPRYAGALAWTLWWHFFYALPLVIVAVAERT